VKSDESHLVYYTIHFGNTGHTYESILDQHIKSVESLRKNNQSIPICVAVWERRLRRVDQQRLESLDVKVRHLGSYAKRLRQWLPGAWADLFNQFPNGQKWISLSDLLDARFDRILYLDNDTFFLRDVEELFERFPVADLCAREEPNTRRSPLGYHPTYIDEAVLSHLLRSEKSNRIVPFNTGVVLMRRQVAEWLSQNLNLFFSYAMRFTMWLTRQPSSTADESFLTAARELDCAEAGNELSALRYPSSNQWILEEFALWFTFAISKFKVRLLPLHSVLQGDEILAFGRLSGPPCLIHYYSANSDYFFWWLRGLERSARPKTAPL
jgi:hypothetical protein